MGAEVLDLVIEQGATFFLPRILLDPLGTPVNLTGFLGRGQIKASAQDLVPLASFEVVIPTFTDGQYQVKLPAAVSSLIPVTGTSYLKPTLLYYDIELYNELTLVSIRVLQGRVSLSPETTK